ncbi:hypothetical protein ACWGOK_27835 [Streptomyces eurythermus]
MGSRVDWKLVCLRGVLPSASPTFDLAGQRLGVGAYAWHRRWTRGV